jgi:hypothetical protein
MDDPNHPVIHHEFATIREDPKYTIEKSRLYTPKLPLKYPVPPQAP